jgi:hypothetical protein
MPMSSVPTGALVRTLQRTENTIKATTHLRVQTVNHLNVERRWPTGDRPLRYRRLDHAVYHDTMYSEIKSLRGNKCCEIYVTDFGWSSSFPLTREAKVHETLDLFLGRYGIPEALISDVPSPIQEENTGRRQNRLASSAN